MFRRRTLLKKFIKYFFLAVAILGFLTWHSFGLNLLLQELKRNAMRKEPRSFEHKTTLITSTRCVQHYFLLILVSSAPSYFQRRRDIRQTWGVDTAIRPRWKTAFLVAQTRNKRESDSLLKEDDAFGDLVRAGYYEHYWNQTFKIQMGFEWAARYCRFTFLLKMDDDTFVNTKALISYLIKTNTPRKRLYLGLVWKNIMPSRNATFKWRVSQEEYNRTYYPDYCGGFGFVLSADVVNSFVGLFDVVPAFRFDDVYVGMLADKLGMKGTLSKAFKHFPKPAEHKPQCIPPAGTLVWHGLCGECLMQAFNHTAFQPGR